MNRKEILDELQQIVAITDGKSVSATVAYCPEAAQRAKRLIQVVESWPTAFPPAPFVSAQCCEGLHGACVNGACHCACHGPPEAPQQPREPALPTVSQPFEAWRKQQESAYEAGHDQAAANQPPARHIDTPDELLELLAGVSSDPQIEGLSLAQKASTMAMLYVAKALQQIAGDVKCLNENTQEGFDTVCIAIEPLGKALQEIAENSEDFNSSAAAEAITKLMKVQAIIHNCAQHGPGHGCIGHPKQPS